MRRFSLVTSLILLICISGCDLWGSGAYEPDKVVLGDTTGTLSVTGTVQYIDVEGGFWAIVGRAEDAEDSETYNPINLPESFEVDGQPVRVRAEVLEDRVSIHMVGPIIEVRSIEPR